MKSIFRPIQRIVSLRHGPDLPEGMTEPAAIAAWEAENVQTAEVVVKPLPIGMDSLISAWIPAPPKQPKVDARGNVVSNALGPVMADPDPAAVNAHNNARMFARMALQVPAIETPRPPAGAPVAEWLAFASAVAAELQEAQWTMGDITKVLVAMAEVNDGGGSLGNS